MMEEEKNIDAIKKKKPVTNVTAKARANKYSEDFEVIDDILHCSWCNKIVDHTKESTIKDHL